MFEDLSSRISKVTNLKYLTPIVLYNSKDKHYYLSLLYHIQNIGIHHILCMKLREMEIKEEIPQLIEIMLKPIDGSPISYPIYDLLLVNAKKSVFFRISLFFRLKSVLSTVEENLASYCYFLCCSILEIDSKEYRKNISGLKTRLKIAKNIKKLLILRNLKIKKRMVPLSRQFSINKKIKLPDLHGLMLFFIKSLVSMFDSNLSGEIDTFYHSFENKKNYKNLQFRLGQTPFKSNIMFYENLAEISVTLKKIPAHLRSRALKILLEFTNLQLGREIIDPFNNKKKILKLVVEHAKTQDSAENCPFVVFAEVADRNSLTYNLYSPKIKKTKALLRQLESLNDLDDIGDVDGIKESILTALENILFINQETIFTNSQNSDSKLSQLKYINLNENKLQEHPNTRKCGKDEILNCEFSPSNANTNSNYNNKINQSVSSDNSNFDNTLQNKLFKNSCPNFTELNSDFKISESKIESGQTIKSFNNENEATNINEDISNEITPKTVNNPVDYNTGHFSLHSSNDKLEKLSLKVQNKDSSDENTTKLMRNCNSDLFSQEIDSSNTNNIDKKSENSNTHHYSFIDSQDENIQTLQNIFSKDNSLSEKFTIQGDESSIYIQNTEQYNIKSPVDLENSLKNFDTLVTGDKFAELVPSLNINPRIIHDSSLDKKHEIIHKRDFIDAYACDSINAEPLAMINDRSMKNLKQKLALKSEYSSYPGWNITSFIIKSGGILKHEYLAYQALSQMKEIFILEKLPIYLRNYQIGLISDTSGLVELVQDAQSIHRIKFDNKFKTLLSYFEHTFKGENFKKAKENFLYSLVGYSLASYILQIKDRHNGNLLIDSFGHIIHVDFGFTFGKFPGILVSIENAPFKFSSEYLDLIDLAEFKDLFIQGLKALNKHREKATRLIEIMKESGYYDKSIFDGIIQRLKIGDNEIEIEALCQSLISNSLSSKGTAIYDHYQYFYNGYL